MYVCEVVISHSHAGRGIQYNSHQTLGSENKNKPNLSLLFVDPHQLFSFPFSIFNFRFLEELLDWKKLKACCEGEAALRCPTRSSRTGFAALFVRVSQGIIWQHRCSPLTQRVKQFWRSITDNQLGLNLETRESGRIPVRYWQDEENLIKALNNAEEVIGIKRVF